MAIPVLLFCSPKPNGNENMGEGNRDGSATSGYRKRDHDGEDALGITGKNTKNSQQKWLEHSDRTAWKTNPNVSVAIPTERPRMTGTSDKHLFTL
jgi:hypothetical protein